MPIQRLPTSDEFFEFQRKMVQGLRFRELYGVEVTNEIRRIRAKAPRRREGHETGFTFSANGLTAIVWTTWLSKDARARDEDAGWVLVKEGGNPQYFSHPIHRTRNFPLTLYRHAWLAHWRVLNRPYCRECWSLMIIARGKGLKARYWRCDNRLQHRSGAIQTRSWDYGLPEKALLWVKNLRRARAAKRKAARRCGASRRPAMFSRKTWTSEK